MIGYKRKGRSSSARLRGQRAGMRFSRVQPWSTYGAARIPRGSQFSLGTFGRTYRSASAMQKRNRQFHGFTGKGRYVWNTLKKINVRRAFKRGSIRRALKNPNIRRSLTQSADLGMDLLSSTVAPGLATFGGPVGALAAADLSATALAYDKLNHRGYAAPSTLNPRQIAARTKPNWRR